MRGETSKPKATFLSKVPTTCPVANKELDYCAGFDMLLLRVC